MLREELLKIGLELGDVISVPDYECGVQAGLPADHGNMPSGGMFIPEELAAAGSVYTVKVRGESMIDYDIKEGDRLIVHFQSTAESGDIVIAMVNGACTVKTFFEDEDGDLWLIPGNPDFTPIKLLGGDDNRIIGIVKQIIHETPRISYRECVKAIKASKKEHRQQIKMEDIVRALKAAVEAMTERGLSGSRPWFAVYRTFTDRGVIEKGDYTGFVALLENIMGEEAPSINVKDMRGNIDVQSFEKPVSLWSVDDAPVGAKRFYDYLEVAKVTNRALSNR